MKEIKLFAKILFGLALISALFSSCSNASDNISAGQSYACTITFNANDGTASPATATQSCRALESITLRANTFTREGYSFKGWSISKSMSELGHVDYTDGAAAKFSYNITL